MKTKLTTLFTVIIMMMTVNLNLNAQEISEECITTGSIFVEAAKVKNYEAARPSFEKLRKDCPQWSLALYQYGERLLKDDLNDATGDQKKSIALDLIEFLKQREQYFPGKTPSGGNAADQAQILFDNKIGTEKSQYDAFNAAFAKDAESISSPKSIYTRFKLAVDLYKQNLLPLQDVFDLYDDTQEKLNVEATKLDSKLQKLLDKEESSNELTSKETRRKKGYETNLKAFAIFGSNTDATMGELGNCENLIPLYEKGYEENKNDIDWINKAASRLLDKECTDDPIFIKLVEQLHKLKPSADSAKYLMILCSKKGDAACEREYFEQAQALETDPKKRADLNYRKAESLRRSGSYGQARSFYNKALADNPSMGKCYLRIAAMYAASANNCGDTVFDKRAVYWLAANTAERAGRVSPSLASNANATAESYRGKAPDKAMIFNGNMGGKTVTIGCWIGSSIRVPNL